ncbi:hypothetical protein NB037_12860 [Rathayibacter sp. ZW T2_19]|uniref:Uncharacterized protein n=1 Tax=Rathayibacter rubneri TaxID=2950106 RepID=A0A9X2DYA4_9MICO|nr:hypothetical protein [Rathayibacter rubneri]MCM6763310.1 hypothetical protein [Rathayibacter rubneri]
MTEQTTEHDDSAGTHGYISDEDQYLRRLRRIEGQAADRRTWSRTSPT